MSYKALLTASLLTGYTLFSATAVAHNGSNQLDVSEAPADAKAYIIHPQDGATVSSTFTVKFGLRGMGVAPAGIDMKNTGHHHLMVDMDELPEAGQPMGGNVTHFGMGQTETEVTLEPGEHTLQIILGDKNHVPHDPMVVSEKITVTVEE